MFLQSMASGVSGPFGLLAPRLVVEPPYPRQELAHGPRQRMAVILATQPQREPPSLWTVLKTHAQVDLLFLLFHVHFNMCCT